MAVRAHVRQCDPSLPLHWHDAPPQEVRLLLRDLLHAASSVIVLLPHVMEALLYLQTRARIELFALLKFQPVVFFSIFYRSSNHCACQMQSVTFPRQRQILSVRRCLWPSCNAVAASLSKFFAYVFLAACVLSFFFFGILFSPIMILHHLPLTSVSFLSVCLKL